MGRYFLSAILSVLLVAGSANAQNVTRHVQVTDEFAEGQFRWHGIPGGYEYRINLIVVEGVYELCGVGVFTNMMARPAATKKLRGAELVIDGRVVIRNFMYFNKVNRARQLNRALASCRSTGVRASRRNIDVDINWPDGSFRN